MNIKLGHKAGSGSQRKPVTAPDSASSKSYARIVYGINDGHMVGFIDGLKSLILDNTPVQSSSGTMNITEVEVQTRWGTNDQDYLEGFPSVVNEIGYSNVEIVSDHNFVHYVNDLNTNAVGIRFTWGKIFRQNESNGDINGYRIDYAIDVQTDGNGFVEVLKTSLNDKTSSGYERYHRLELPPAEVGWEIRVRRLTANTTSDFIGDKMFLSAVAEIVDAKLRYPNTALIALKFDADKFGSIPKADFRLRGKIIKVPTNYNPETRTYAAVGEGTTNGIWDGSFKLAYTNNPVWIFYDLLLSKRYGLGERLDASMVDKWALYSIGQYCDVMVPDGMGGTEPRLTCNVYINSKYEAFDLLMQLASTFRGILHWDGASIVATADRPSDPVFTFTRANIIGEFNYSGTRARDRSSMISVAFDDPANNYKTDKEVVSDTNAIAEVGVRLKELTAFGCTSRGQAQRIGRLGLLKEQQELRMVTFTVGLDGYIPVTGKIIEIADPLLAGRAIGGRISVVSTDGTVITLDREVTANGGDVLVANGDDGIQQRRDITQVNGNVVTVSAAFTGVSAENVWAIDSEDLSLMRFRVLSVAQNRSDDGLITFTISGVQHNPTIDEGADFAAYIEQPTYSNVEIYTQVAPTELVIGSENVINQGLDITNVVFSWPQAVNAVKYELEWRRDNGSWIKAPIIYSNTFVVEDVYHGLYEARIVAINSMDVRSLYTLAQPTIINSKFAEPPMLSFIQATGIQFGAEISWVFPAKESQNAEYVEVQISYREDKTDAKLLGNYAYPLNRAEINGLQANLRLWVKARIIDRNKVEGPWTVWVTATTDAEASILLDALSGMITSSQLDQDLTTDIATGVAADAAASAAKLAADAAAQAAANAQTAANGASVAAATAQTAASNAQTTASTAQTAATNAMTAASNAQTSANDAAASVNALATEVDADITALSTDLTAKLTTLGNGLAQETTDRQNADTQIVGQLNTYKSSNDAALAAVQQKAESATTASTANAQALTNLTATVNTKNRTYRQATAPMAGLVLGDLWINTTAGQNNQLRRWNGTEWDDLTDPRTAANATALTNLQTTVTAIDGRTTANANSITQLRTDLTTLSNNVDAKANASAVDSLTTRVSTAEGNITSQGTRVTNLENSVNHATTGLSTKASSSALTAVDNKVTAANGRIDTTNSNVTTLAGRVSTVEGAVATKAEASALTALTTRVTNAEGVNTSQGSAITTLQNTVNHATTGLSTKASTSALNTLDSKVTGIDGRVTANVTSITNLQAGLKTANNNIALKADGSALTALTTRVTNAEGVNTSQGTAITTLRNTVNHATTGLDSKASSAALTTLDNKVTGIDGRVTSNSSSITSLNNSLTTTNTNVTAAQTAATNAMTAAGQKGKVIFGTTAPVAADQLSQNLWIDTTGNANTPKRWNGTAWVVVTDKAATDALAAANAASSLAATKADASALTSLTTKVDTIDGKVTAQATDILNLSTGLTNLNNSKLDASIIQQYRTAVDQDSVTTSALTQFRSELKIGGVNVLLNSKEPRSGVNEYLDYETSVELKNFYDQHLNKDVTISCEIFVPVAGSVKIYTSNSSAHWFEHNTLLPANQWTRVVATVKPISHDTNPNWATSSLEFYGEYGTGRIVTVRNVQLEAGNFATDWSPSPRDYEKAANLTAEALENVYTKTEANAATAGLIQSFNANLKIGGTNIFSSGTVLDAYNVYIHERSHSVQGNKLAFGTVNTAARTLRFNHVVDSLGWYTVSGFVRGNQGVAVPFAIDFCDQGRTELVSRDDDTNMYFEVSVNIQDTPHRFMDIEPLSWVNYVFTNIKIEKGNKATSWSPSLNETADAAALTQTRAEVQEINGQVSSLSQQTSTLSTTVGNNTAAIQLQQSSIDGINAKAVLQVEAGGTIGGVALGNNGGVVDFLIRSNTFAVAPPVGYSGSNKYLMTYRATPITLPNGTVVSEGLYLNNLTVDYIDASKIYATELSAITANLGRFVSTDAGGSTEIAGKEIIVKDPNGNIRVHIGIFT